MDNAAITPQFTDGAEVAPPEDLPVVDCDGAKVAEQAAPAQDPAVQEAPAQEGSEARRAPRFTLLIRAAKLITSQGEFVCVVRDVSETGVAVRLFHGLPTGDPTELHMPGGGIYGLRNVWDRGNEAGFEFVDNVDVARLISEAGAYPKRGLRLGLVFPITIRTLTGTYEGIVENFSQQGARFECDAKFAIDQNLRIETKDGRAILKDVRAKVRWRRESEYGVVFDDTLTLGDFALFAAKMQCPSLIDPD